MPAYCPAQARSWVSRNRGQPGRGSGTASSVYQPHVASSAQVFSARSDPPLGAALLISSELVLTTQIGLFWSMSIGATKATVLQPSTNMP
jgi:hypothetical protein